jgi:hypothetical protein
VLRCVSCVDLECSTIHSLIFLPYRFIRVAQFKKKFNYKLIFNGLTFVTCKSYLLNKFMFKLFPKIRVTLIRASLVDIKTLKFVG